ncbi:hypothetical protein JCM8097_008513 [Rhodosporidiobolus ruineniae]
MPAFSFSFAQSKTGEAAREEVEPAEVWPDERAELEKDPVRLDPNDLEDARRKLLAMPDWTGLRGGSASSLSLYTSKEPSDLQVFQQRRRRSLSFESSDPVSPAAAHSFLRGSSAAVEEPSPRRLTSLPRSTPPPQVSSPTLSSLSLHSSSKHQAESKSSSAAASLSPTWSRQAFLKPQPFLLDGYEEHVSSLQREQRSPTIPQPDHEQLNESEEDMVLDFSPTLPPSSAVDKLGSASHSTSLSANALTQPQKGGLPSRLDKAAEPAPLPLASSSVFPNPYLAALAQQTHLDVPPSWPSAASSASPLAAHLDSSFTPPSYAPQDSLFLSDRVGLGHSPFLSIPQALELVERELAYRQFGSKEAGLAELEWEEDEPFDARDKESDPEEERERVGKEKERQPDKAEVEEEEASPPRRLSKSRIRPRVVPPPPPPFIPTRTLSAIAEMPSSPDEVDPEEEVGEMSGVEGGASRFDLPYPSLFSTSSAFPPLSQDPLDRRRHAPTKLGVTSSSVPGGPGVAMFADEDGDDGMGGFWGDGA